MAVQSGRSPQNEGAEVRCLSRLLTHSLASHSAYISSKRSNRPHRPDRGVSTSSRSLHSLSSKSTGNGVSPNITNTMPSSFAMFARQPYWYGRPSLPMNAVTGEGDSVGSPVSAFLCMAHPSRVLSSRTKYLFMISSAWKLRTGTKKSGGDSAQPRCHVGGDHSYGWAPRNARPARSTHLTQQSVFTGRQCHPTCHVRCYTTPTRKERALVLCLTDSDHLLQ